MFRSGLARTPTRGLAESDGEKLRNVGDLLLLVVILIASPLSRQLVPHRSWSNTTAKYCLPSTSGERSFEVMAYIGTGVPLTMYTASALDCTSVPVWSQCQVHLTRSKRAPRPDASRCLPRPKISSIETITILQN